MFIDVEGLPDCDFYYLIGLRWPSMNGIEQRSLWADTAEDEGKLWADLLAVLSSIKSPTLVHYGSFETTFFKKMTDRYGAPTEDFVAGKALGSAINLLSVIFAHIYFPTYSNGLKEIAKYLGFNWKRSRLLRPAINRVAARMGTHARSDTQRETYSLQFG